MFSFRFVAGIFLIFNFVQHAESQAFGDDIDSVGFGGDVVSKNEDHRFSDMGQVTKNIFDVAGGTVSLILNVEDTVGVKEIWILDFQEYRYDLDNLPVDEATGRIIAANTSPCSSVYEDQDFDTYLSDDYFQDRDPNNGLESKELFTKFERGDVVDNRRINKVHFNGSIATWFECTESDLITKVWQLTSDANDVDEIEYRTKIYAINVRPKDVENPLGGISFVQSHIELIWRLSRTALSNVIISSTALLQPIIEFARVSAIFDSEGEPVPTQAHLHLRFRTAVDSDEQMVTYIADSLVYTPDISTGLVHGLRYTSLTPDTTLLGGPQCTFQLDEGTGSQLQCNQVWEFKFVLDIDIAGHVDNRAPIDASGTFEFNYWQYTCVNNNNLFDVASCTLLSDEPAKIAAVITIQTTVFVQDEEDDQVAIMLVALKGADNQELSVDGARGIAHKEDLTLEVKFSPALLREDYKLDLLLFMVCRGEQYMLDEFPHGCLQADALDRYVAHRNEAFIYTPTHQNESGIFEGTPYQFSDVSSDYYQGLGYEGYVEDDEFGRPLPVPVHRSTFTNLALSAEHAKYVITTIYKLSDKPARKRRESGYNEVIISKVTLDDALSYYHGNPVIKRYRRDIDDSASVSHGQRYAYTSLGCPEDALHKDMDCHCPAGTEYSARSFQCEKDNEIDNEIMVDVDVVDIEETDLSENDLHEKANEVYSGTDGLSSCIALLVLCIGLHLSNF